MAEEDVNRSRETTDDWNLLLTDSVPTRFTFLYKLLLRLVHWLLAVAISLVHVVTTVRRYTWNRRARLPNAHFRTNFSKLPVHLALSLESNPHGGNGLSGAHQATSCVASLVAWCVIVGIPYVTLYDHEGMLKSYVNELRQLIDDHLSTIVGTNRLRSRCIIRVSDGESTQNNNLQRLEKERKDVVQVQLLSYQDGRQELVAACRRLADCGKNKSTAEFVVDDFVEQMQPNRGFPSPDVLVCWGESFSTLGFPPWHINLSEIIYLPSRVRMTFDTFHGILSRFEKCEGRFGK